MANHRHSFLNILPPQLPTLFSVFLLLCRRSRYYSFFVIPTPRLLILSFCHSDTQITSIPLLSLPYPNYQYSPFVIPTPKLPVLPFCHSDTQITSIALLSLPYLNYQYSPFVIPTPKLPVRLFCYSDNQITNIPLCFYHSATPTTNIPFMPCYLSSH